MSCVFRCRPLYCRHEEILEAGLPVALSDNFVPAESSLSMALSCSECFIAGNALEQGFEKILSPTADI